MKTTLFLIIILMGIFSLFADEKKTAKDYYNDGSSKALAGDNKGAILDFDKAIELDPEDADSYKNRGLSKVVIGDYAGASQDFNKADSLVSKKISPTKKVEVKQPKELTSEEKKKEEEKNSSEKYYAKLKNPPGFYEGAFLVGFMGGTTIAPGGSYISHEKTYDQRLQGKIITDQVNQDINPDYKGIYFQPSYNPGIASQFDFEYGWRDKIGLGFTIMQNSIMATRQDVIPGIISYSKEHAELFPMKRTIYRGSSMMFLATYHFLPKNFFDPYVAFRVGVVGFTGEAHSGIDSNRFAYTNQINNGIGGIVGAAGGLNIYFGRYTGIKTEVAYYSEYLRSDQFSTRTLYSFQAMIGFFLNFSNIQYSIEESSGPKYY